MKIKTAHNHKARAKSALLELINNAKHFGMTHDQMLTEKKQIMESIAKCPEWVITYCQGYYDALFEQIQQRLIFGYTLPDGRVLSTHKNRPDYYEKHGLGPQDVYKQATHTGHYWNVNGELKPFSVGAKQ